MPINENNIFQYGMLIAIKSGSFQGRKKMTEEQLRNLPNEIVRGVHDLFDTDFKKLLRKANNIVHESVNRIKDASVPFPIEAVYFLTTNKIEWAIEFLDKAKEKRDDVVEEILFNYENAIEVFAQKYPDYYEAAKSCYPSVEKLRERYYFDYQFVKISSPDEKAKGISGTQYKKEMVKFREMITEMKKEVSATIYESLLETTEKLKGQLENGKPNQNTLNSLNKFLAQIDDVYADFVDRDDMKATIAKVRAQFLGVSASDLRSSPEEAKKRFAKEVTDLGKEIKALPDIPLKRAIDF